MNLLSSKAVRAVLSAGLSAGTLDIGVASLIYQLSPRVILQSIASGLIGQASFKGGARTALLGLLLQWAMSILIAIIYLVATVPLPDMRRRWPMSGVIAGVTTYVVMSYLVVPLSAAPFRPSFTLEGLFKDFTLYNFVVSLLAMILFGLIIAFFLRNVEDSRVLTADDSPRRRRSAF